MIWRNLGFFISLFLLFIAGFLIQYSVSVSENFETFNKHLFFFIFCLPISAIIIFTPIEKIISINKLVYYINLLILTGVLIIGKTSLGATRWLNLGGVTFQPSEFVKISVILIIANYFSKATCIGSIYSSLQLLCAGLNNCRYYVSALLPSCSNANANYASISYNCIPSYLTYMLLKLIKLSFIYYFN